MRSNATALTCFVSPRDSSRRKCNDVVEYCQGMVARGLSRVGPRRGFSERARLQSLDPFLVLVMAAVVLNSGASQDTLGAFRLTGNLILIKLVAVSGALHCYS